MKQLLTLMVAMGLIISCSDPVVLLPDVEDRVSQNEADITTFEARIALLEVNDALQDLRLDALEAAMANAEARLDAVEAAIDANEGDIATLFAAIDGLTGDLATLHSEYANEVRKLRMADKRTRRTMRKNIRELRRKLCREIRARKLADANLQGQIDGLERNLNRFEAKQKVVNKMLAFGLFMINMRISQLENDIERDLAKLNSRLNYLSGKIRSMKRELSRMRWNIRDIRRQLDNLDTENVTVQECNGETVLLVDGEAVQVAYETEEVSQCFEAGTYIPTHFICDQFHNGWGSKRMCKYGRNISGYTAEIGACVRFDVITHVFLTTSEEEVCYVD